MLRDWRTYKEEALDNNSTIIDHKDFRALYARIQTLRDSNTLEPQSLDNLNKLTGEANYAAKCHKECREIIGTWQKMGVPTSPDFNILEEPSYAALRLRTEILAANPALAAHSRHQLNGIVTNFNKEIAKLRETREEHHQAPQQPTPPDPEKLQKLQAHFDASATLAKTYNTLERSTDMLGLPLITSPGYSQWSANSDRNWRETKQLLTNPDFKNELEHHDTKLRLEQLYGQIAERHADAKKSIEQSRTEETHQKQADQNATTPEQKEARKAYRETMRDIASYQKARAEYNNDPIHHYQYPDTVQAPLTKLIDTPALDSHTRNKLQDLKERQLEDLSQHHQKYEKIIQERKQREEISEGQGKGLSIRY